jgi:hypothetical protein
MVSVFTKAMIKIIPKSPLCNDFHEDVIEKRTSGLGYFIVIFGIVAKTVFNAFVFDF